MTHSVVGVPAHNFHFPVCLTLCELFWLQQTSGSGSTWRQVLNLSPSVSENSIFSFKQHHFYSSMNCCFQLAPESQTVSNACMVVQVWSMLWPFCWVFSMTFYSVTVRPPWVPSSVVCIELHGRHFRLGVVSREREGKRRKTCQCSFN